MGYMGRSMTPPFQRNGDYNTHIGGVVPEHGSAVQKD